MAIYHAGGIALRTGPDAAIGGVLLSSDSHLWSFTQHRSDTTDDTVPHGFSVADSVVVVMAVRRCLVVCRCFVVGGVAAVADEPGVPLAGRCDSRLLEP